MKRQTKAALKKLSTMYGGQNAAAKALGIAQSVMSEWGSGVYGVDPIKAMHIERQTNGEIKAVDLCPALAEFNK